MNELDKLAGNMNDDDKDDRMDDKEIGKIYAMDKS